ncbi:MAG TPA: DNA-3-methyladenine glycosylase [Candidatus Saccharimonadales bacterium]|nr:DNA-3-methyladenine glycosylase [Candidatus Saccharimonadales bacterium]
MLPQSFYAQSALSLAARLLGCELIHESKEGTTTGLIVETEAYHTEDPASHSFRGQTKRNAVMFGPPGYAYIYLSYGIHRCMNVVAGRDGVAEAVLIRALEPTGGIPLMEHRRSTTLIRNLCSGPGKLVQAMGIVAAQNGASLNSPRLYIRPRTAVPPVMASPRIGISQAVEQPWRFFIAGNPHVTSHKFNNASVPWRYEMESVDTP